MKILALHLYSFT